MNHFILAYDILTVRTVKVKSLKIEMVHHIFYSKSPILTSTNISQLDDISKFFVNIFA